ncbi:MAG: chemotaxis protein CheD [Synergistaceae bacterium]|nr:chemotaxis protein CheD [Synergistaceae bacterium]
MENTYHVGMADVVAVSSPAKLITLGLGSCIGLVIYDEIAKVAAMAHIMLPESRGGKEPEKPGKFADLAVPFLLEELLKKHAQKERLKAKFAGGAQMFANVVSSGGADFLAVGVRNAAETLAFLNKFKIKIVASDTGGNKGRTVEFNTETWMLSVKVLGKGITMI